MQPFSYAFVAVAFVSFFGEQLLQEPFGIYGAMLVAVFSVLIPELLECFIVMTRFSPDVTITADPLKPDAKTVAGGLREAMRQSLSVQKPVRVLVSRVPGYGVDIAFNAVRQRCFVDMKREEDSRLVGQSQSALPSFTPGLEQACFHLSGNGDNLRLVIKPDGDRGERVQVVTPRSSRYLLVAVGGFGFLVARLSLGVPTACLAVLPLVLFRFVILFRGGHRPAFPVTATRISKGPLFFTAVSLAVVVFNLLRLGLW